MSPVPRDVIDADVRKVIAMARELAALKAPDLAAHTGADPADVLGAYAAAFGEAKVLLRALAAVAERLMALQVAAALEANPEYQSALRDAESESWDGPGIDGAEMIAAAGERRRAAAEFLAASTAVWKEIDRLDAEPERYHPVRMSVELRERERAAWERYRDLLPAEGVS
jgi:hypothetical protein